jgi:hypothetical protein
MQHWNNVKLLEGLKEMSRENPAYFFNLLVKDSSLLDESLHDQQLSIPPKDRPGYVPWGVAEKMGQYQGRRYNTSVSRISYRSNEGVFPGDGIYVGDYY